VAPDSSVHGLPNNLLLGISASVRYNSSVRPRGVRGQSGVPTNQLLVATSGGGQRSHGAPDGLMPPTGQSGAS
jgi:hypothetical protein